MFRGGPEAGQRSPAGGPFSEGCGRASSHPQPLLYQSRLLVRVNLSSTLTLRFTPTPERVSRTFLRCLVDIFPPCLPEASPSAPSSSSFQSCPLQDREQQGPPFPKTFPGSYFSKLVLRHSLDTSFSETLLPYLAGLVLEDPRSNCQVGFGPAPVRLAPRQLDSLFLGTQPLPCVPSLPSRDTMATQKQGQLSWKRSFKIP